MLAKEDVAVGVGGLVAIIHELGVGADLAIVAGNELEEMQHGALVDGAGDERRGSFKEALFNVPSKAHTTHGEVLGLRPLDLQDVEVHKAHREHVVGEEGELVFAVRVVRLEGYIRSIYVLMLHNFPSDTSCQV